MKSNEEAFAALHCRNFRLYVIGQSTSMLGLWMKRLAMSWLVFRLTQSTFLLSITEFLGLAPILLIGPIAGAWLDQHDLRKTLIISQFGCLIQAVLLAVLCASGLAQYWSVTTLALTLGIINAVDLPCRQSSVSQLVDSRRELKSAIAINSIVFNLSKLVGPAIAGFIVYRFGETFCFVLSALCYLPIQIMLICFIRYNPRTVPAKRQQMLRGVLEGLSYIRSEFIMRRLFELLGWGCLFAISYQVLFPLFATQVLHGGPQLLGSLLGGAGLGAIIAVSVMATRVSMAGLPRWLLVVCGMVIFGFAAFSLSSYVWLSLAMSLCIGFGVVSLNVCINTMLQSVAAEDKRSRVLSLYVMCNNGIGPCGGLLMGVLADTWGAQTTMLICAGGMALVTLRYALNCTKVKIRLKEMLRNG